MRPWRVAHVEQRRYVHSASDWLGSERYERLRLGLLSAQEVGHLQGAPGAAQTRKLLELKAGHSAAAAANEMASVEIHWAQVRLPDPSSSAAGWRIGDGRIGDGRIGDGWIGDGWIGDGRSGDGRSGDGRSGDGRSGSCGWSSSAGERQIDDRSVAPLGLGVTRASGGGRRGGGRCGSERCCRQLLRRQVLLRRELLQPSERSWVPLFARSGQVGWRFPRGRHGICEWNEENRSQRRLKITNVACSVPPHNINHALRAVQPQKQARGAAPP